MPRKCTICTHEEAKKINVLIAKGVSFRNIAKQILQSERNFQSIFRHAENCLNYESSAKIEEMKLNSAEQYHAEIGEQLTFARDLRIAARKYLTDEFGELSLLPVSNEIDIVYFDYKDLDKKNFPKKKTAKLDNILQEIYKEGAKQADKWSIKQVDIRSYALDCIKTTDVVLDKIAKREGLYQKDSENVSDIQKIADLVNSYIAEHPEYPKEEVIKVWARKANVEPEELSKYIN